MQLTQDRPVAITHAGIFQQGRWPLSTVFMRSIYGKCLDFDNIYLIDLSVRILGVLITYVC